MIFLKTAIIVVEINTQLNSFSQMETINAELKNSINKIIYTRSKATGRLTEIVYDDNNDPQYAIIATNYFAGNRERYFAIPVLPAFLEITTNGSIACNLTQNDLVLARRVRFENCPTIQENDFFPSVYEVSGYESPPVPAKKKVI